ncbi:hypothetical protein AWH60_11225 [Pseudoalteromonas haloplanktis]|nr:hypothetical protein AWH60_11225 [Pseudoalteromonas haloplanktis]
MLSVSINRVFAEVAQDDLNKGDAYLLPDGRYGAKSWTELDDCQCVVILGEGKCGKTFEFQKQDKLLKEQNKYSFFVALEQLQDFDFLDVITENEELRFEEWQKSSDQEAYFFLDAVDELKLRSGSLRSALRKIKNAIGIAVLPQAKFYISCRPNDWKDEIDIAALRTLLANRNMDEEETEEFEDGEKELIKLISNAKTTSTQNYSEKTSSEDKIKIYSLLSFNNGDIERFANSYAPEHSEKFINYLNSKELWHLYHLPYEIMSALDQFSSDGRLGDLQEQLDYSISQKLKEHSLIRGDLLSEKRALEAVERIAFALFMMQRRSISLEATPGKPHLVCISEILTDFSPAELAELIRKPIFTITGVKQFRFHHRASQEYLAAKQLKKLKENGLKTNDLFNFLFAEISGEKVLIPSMEPITAWMALWNRDIFNEVKTRSPALMFRQGIPALLDLEQRAELIRCFVSKYSQNSGWSGVGIGQRELQKIASPELSGVIRECWDEAYKGYETRELLIELIYFTPLVDCTDLSWLALHDCDLNMSHRVYAAWTILEFGSVEDKKELGKIVLSDEWPQRFRRQLISKLLPESITLAEFIALAQELEEVPNDVHGLGFELYKCVESNAIDLKSVATIRDSFTQTIWENRTAESRIFQANSKFQHFADAVYYSCSATVPYTKEEYEGWAWSLSVAFHFSEYQESIIARDEVKALKQILKTSPAHREAYYWACLKLATALEGKKDHRISDYHIDHPNLLNPFGEIDIPWLLDALTNSKSKDKRDASLFRLLQLVTTQTLPKLEDTLKEVISEDIEYYPYLQSKLHPEPIVPDELELEIKQREKEAKVKEEERVKGWTEWRKQVLNSPTFELDEEKFENTFYNIFKMLRQSESNNMKWGEWGSEPIERIFSKEFLDAIRTKLSQYWKDTDIKLFSEKPAEEKNTYSHISLMSLSAVKCSAETEGWENQLSHEEAVKAVRISLLELNDFADYLPKLVAAKPAAVKEALTKEVMSQIDEFSQIKSAPIFARIIYSKSDLIKKTIIEAALNRIEAISAILSEGPNTDIKYIFQLASTVTVGYSMDIFASLLEEHLKNSKVDNADLVQWVKLFAHLDIIGASEFIFRLTDDLSTVELKQRGVSLFANIFGDRHHNLPPTFEEIEKHSRLEILNRLMNRCYEAVDPKDDNVREGGSYRPDMRDDAEYARSYLLQCISKVHDIRTIGIIQGIAKIPQAKHLECRLNQMAIDVAASLSEPETPMNVRTFNKLVDKNTYIPLDNAGLFKVMKSRLDDFEHHLLKDEFSTIDTFRAVRGELEARRFISAYLDDKNRRAYSVTQEAVVISEKRTDIRLQATSFDSYASIELKIDDKSNKWSGSALRKALTDQLIGQYLNHERCYVGCLLIMMRETRKWKHPVTGRMMTLAQTVEWLQSEANAIMQERSELRVAVKGIDYSSTANESLS